MSCRALLPRTIHHSCTLVLCSPVAGGQVTRASTASSSSDRRDIRYCRLWTCQLSGHVLRYAQASAWVELCCLTTCSWCTGRLFELSPYRRRLTFESNVLRRSMARARARARNRNRWPPATSWHNGPPLAQTRYPRMTRPACHYNIDD
ncbi:hypothetical protein C8Q74DRAFT_432375 [Fomes fomentarius]|nr:hypothetical protein C8Q74DRAFT_432375 [Fomes fomentarius]